MSFQWIQTFTGKQFFFDKIRPSSIYIEDIAHSLSQICRFAGACRQFYSVAEHSVRVVEYLRAQSGPRSVLAWGLIHDFPEAYIGDIPGPFKHIIPGIDELEGSILTVIAAKFDLQGPMPDIVKTADRILLSTECRDLMLRPPAKWTNMPLPLKGVIKPWSPETAKERLLDLYDELI